MMRQYNALKKDHPDKILFFRMGDFYEMFGPDAVTAARVLQIALTSRDKKRENSIPMCGIPYHAYEQYLNKLTASGFKVAICEQMEDPAQAQGIVKREIVRIVTPGTTVSPQLIHPDHNHYLLAIHTRLQQKQLGVAFVDVSTGEFEIVEFSTADMPRIYDFLYQIAPQEILFPQSRSHGETQFLEEFTGQIEQLLRKNKQPPPSISFIDPYYFDQDATEKLLKSHFKVFNLSGFGVGSLNLGVAAAGALLQYLKETQKCELHHLTSIKQYSFDQFMLLDETTISNLELFESNSGSASHTLYGVLQHCCTAMGSRMLRQWLRQPLLDIDSINLRFDGIEEFHRNYILCEELRIHLKRIQDIPRISGRISLPVVGIQDLVALRESLLPIVELPEFLQHFESPLLNEVKEQFDPLNDILNLLQTQLLEEPATKLREGNYMADGISDELDQLRDLSQNTKQILNEMVQIERENTGLNSLKIGYNKVFGYYLEVSNARRKEMPEYYIRKQTLVNAERYITPDLKELEEKILGAEERINELEYELFQNLKNSLIEQIDRIQKTAEDIALVDVLACLSYAAENNNYVRPRLFPLNSARKMSLKACRHPVIEQIDFDEPFIPNDIDLNEKDQQIMLITGPNMAGKSTVMRQVALNILMAQCGSYIPAEFAEFSILDRVFTRVGATDKLSQGESTFMVEMNEAASILNNATERSLIILDEIGRGTSTFDGISLAWSIVEHLHELGALTLCATHYHELTAVAQQLVRVKNFNVLIKEENDQIIFMRKIVSGEADKSYGVHVAKLAGLPESVIHRAMEVMAKLESSSLEAHLPKPAASSRKSSKSKNSGVSKKSVKEPPSSYQAQSATQLDFFSLEPPFIQELKELDLDNMTPLQSMSYLHDLIRRIKK
ncbi:MAG: DNA mismatch repair protein MutS [SAR324 cluster bacterium]|nr:DNA mismatch repair protein MutS [SAR324 cluster bacterium]